jgi:hypothetical protein
MVKVKESATEELEKVNVELLEVKKGTHTIYHKLGVTSFNDGMAEVTEEVAAVLKEAGMVK